MRAAIALLLYAIWFGVAFVFRSIIQLRRTGATGFKGLSAKPLSAEWVAGVLFVIALMIGALAPVADLAGWLEPVAFLANSASEWAGAATAIVGIVLTLLAQLSMGESWRIGVDHSERTRLMTAGAFTICRNPIFSAMVVTAIGLAVLVGNALALVGLASLLVALQLQVRVVEEPYLIATHGDTYVHYRAAVGRFVPGLGRVRLFGDSQEHVPPGVEVDAPHLRRDTHER